MALPDRKHLTRLDRIYVAGEPLYYITCCVLDRRPVLANPVSAEILAAAWREADVVHGWQIGRYVVMPDHVHFFASSLAERAKPLSKFMESWKRWTRRKMAERGIAFRWQAEFFDHLLRNSESYSAKWDYVRLNPVRAGLVTTPDEWPYQGEIASLQW